jgi:hypothetical protein
VLDDGGELVLGVWHGGSPVCAGEGAAIAAG